MTVLPHHTASELEQKRLTTRDPKARRRLQVILLAQQGLSAAVIGRQVGLKTQTVASWMTRYNRHGLAALQDAPRSGRPSRLSTDQLARFEQRLEAGAQPADGVCSLRGLDLQRILEREFGVLYSLNGIYRLLHHLGYKPLMPRPQHCQSAPQAQEDFKKGSLMCWAKCESNASGTGNA